MPAEEDTALTYRLLLYRICDEINKGNFGIADQIAAPNKRDIAKEFGIIARTAFPDLQLTIEDMVSEGEKIAVRWTARGTHQGELKNTKVGQISPTGKHVAVSGMTILRLDRGKIVESWGVTDEATAFQQLGMLRQAG